MNILRSLRRSVAHNNMKKAGLRRVNKGEYFAKNWRDYVGK